MTSSSSPPPAQRPSPPIRPSASLVILSPTNRVLLLQRTASLSFALAHVFPGGVLSPSDRGNARLCALRETFEETGLLLTTALPPPSVRTQLPEIQQQLHTGTLQPDLAGWIASWGGALVPESSLRPFTTWITPAQMKVARRFENRLFITTLPHWISEDAVVAGDGGKEVVGAACWVHPAAALRMARAGEMTLFPPQLYLLSHLADCLAGGPGDGREALLSRVDEVGGFVCEPRLETVLDDGTWVLELGPKGDRTVNIHIEPASVKGGEPRAVALVPREDKTHEKL